MTHDVLIYINCKKKMINLTLQQRQKNGLKMCSFSIKRCQAQHYHKIGLLLTKTKFKPKINILTTHITHFCKILCDRRLL